MVRVRTTQEGRRKPAFALSGYRPIGSELAKDVKGAPQFVKYFGRVLDALKELGGSGRPDEVRANIAPSQDRRACPTQPRPYLLEGRNQLQGVIDMLARLGIQMRFLLKPSPRSNVA